MNRITQLLLLTLTQLASELGLSRRTIHYWKSNPETARKHLPKIKAHVEKMLSLIKEEEARHGS